jgi:hypothetical protein
MMIWVRLMLLVLVAMTFAGCEIVGGIFKAGAFVGALAVILAVGVIAFIAMKIRG